MVDVIKSGQQSTPYDTLFIGGEYEFRYWIENSFKLAAFYVECGLISDYGIEFTWVPKQDGWGSNGQGSDPACVTVVPGCRMDPPDEVWNMVFGIYDFGMGELFSDTFGVSGYSIGDESGMESGPLEHMFSAHFKPTGPWAPGLIGNLCIDTAMSWIDGSVQFMSAGGGVDIPICNVSHCWPVVIKCGNPNGDNDVNVGDVVFLINHIFRDGPAPVPWQLGDANSDGTLDVGDVVFLIAASFRNGPQPECP
jgi:hypothetical protein